MVTQRSVFFPVCKQMAHFWLCKKKKEKEEEKKKTVYAIVWPRVEYKVYLWAVP